MFGNLCSYVRRWLMPERWVAPWLGCWTPDGWARFSWTGEGASWPRTTAHAKFFGRATVCLIGMDSCGRVGRQIVPGLLSC